MKKIYSFLFMLFLMIFTAIPAFAYEEMNVDIKDVQNTTVQLVYKKQDISQNTLDSLNNQFKVKVDGNLVYIEFNVSNVVFDKDFNDRLNDLSAQFNKHDPQLAGELEKINLVLDTSFFGYSFGGRTTLVAEADYIPNPINIKMDGKFSINNGEYVSEATLAQKDFPLTMEYGTTTIDSIDITLEIFNDYKKSEVKYDIYSETGALKDMSVDELTAYGFNVVSMSGNNLVLEMSYTDLGGLNNLFNMDMVNILNVIGKIDVSTHKSLMKGMTVEGDFIDSENVENITLTVVLPEEATDTINNVESKSFKYDISRPVKFNIEYNKLNWSVMAVILIVPTCMIFVVAILLMMNKRGAHIRQK